MWSFRSALAAAALLGLTLSAVPQTPPKNPPGGQKPKPPAATPKKPQTPPKKPVNPIVELHQKVVKLVKAAADDMAAERQYILAVLGDRGYGTWVPSDDKGNGSYTSRIPADYGESEVREMDARIAGINQKFDRWAKKQIDDWHMLAGLGGLYNDASSAIRTAHGFAHSGALLMARVLQSELDHKREAGIASLQKQLAAEFEGVSASNNPAAYSRYLVRYDELYDKMAKSLWDEILSQALKEHAHIGISRRKWCVAMWEFYDFAKSKTANPKDGHENAAQVLLKEIDSFFSNPPRGPVRPTGVPRLEWPAAIVNAGAICMSSSQAAVSKDFPYVLAREHPEIQYFPEALSYIVLNFGFEPDVIALHNAKEEKSPWGVWDVRVVPPLVAGDVPATGRVQPEPSKNGYPSYVLYVYGPKVPSKLSEFQSAKMSADSTGGVAYEPLAFSGDFRSGKLALPLQNRFRAAQYLTSLGLNAQAAASMKDMPAVLLQATLGAGIMPGRQKFTINGTEAGWYIDQGTTKAEIRWVQEMNDRPDSPPSASELRFEPINMAHPGEDIRLEVKLSGSIPEKQIEVITGKDGVWMCPEGKLTFFLDEAPKASATDRPIFRSQTIHLVHPNDPRLDLTNPNRKPGVIYFGVSAGETVQGAFADPRKFIGGEAATQIEIHGAPLKSLWQDALTRAARAHGIEGDVSVDGTLKNRTVQEMTTFNVTQVVFKSKLRYVLSPGYFLLMDKLYGTDVSRGDATVTNRVKLYDHAAMILLRDRFIERMLEVNSQVNRAKGDKAHIDFMEAMRPAVMADPDFPLGSIEVTPLPPDSTTPLPAKPLREYYKLQRKPGYNDFVIQNAFREGFVKYRDSVAKSLEHAESVDETKVDELLGLVGNGFSFVVEDLRPSLLKPVRDAAGEMRWVPDYNARAAVNGVNALFEAVRAQKEYKALDTQVVLAVASLTPVALPAGIIKTVVSLALNAVFVVDAASIHSKSMAQEREAQFALGAHAVLGTERFYMADLQRTPTWAIALNIVGGSLAGVSGGAEILDLMGKLSKHGAARVAQQVLFEIKDMGVPGFAKLTKEQKAAFLAFGAGVDLKVAQQSVESLNATEEEAKAMIALLDEELKAAEKAGKAAMAPRPSAPIPSTLADTRPVVTGFPTGPCRWKAPNGDVLSLGALLNKTKTTYFNVFRLDGVKRVAKVLKMTGADALDAWASIKKAIQALDDAKIPYKAIHQIEEMVDHSGYLIQDLLEFSERAGQEAFVLQDWLDLGKELTPQMQEAVVDLVRKLKAKNIVFEDMNLGNIYIERSGRGYIAGVLDVDRVAYWGDFSYQMNYVMGIMQHAPHELNIRSAIGRFMLEPTEIAQTGGTVLTMDEFWSLTMERFGYVSYANEGRYVSGLLPVDKLQEFLVTLKRRAQLDLSRRADPVPPANLNPRSGSPPLERFLERLHAVIRSGFKPIGSARGMQPGIA